MVYGWIFGLLILVGVSLWFRVRLRRDTVSGVETTVSPLSLAVQELVATAGGVYLAIVALTSFLKLETPDKVTLLQASVDPLALTAIGLALVQPIVIRIYHKFKSSR
ncbi:MAG TPA: hypothetical protein PKA10_12950 [Selenomonadales bacterium]|nr:hypothetical protein [Selenomonadales bacterium]